MKTVAILCMPLAFILTMLLLAWAMQQCGPSDINPVDYHQRQIEAARE